MRGVRKQATVVTYGLVGLRQSVISKVTVIIDTEGTDKVIVSVIRYTKCAGDRAGFGCFTSCSASGIAVELTTIETCMLVAVLETLKELMLFAERIATDPNIAVGIFVLAVLLLDGSVKVSTVPLIFPIAVCIDRIGIYTGCVTRVCPSPTKAIISSRSKGLLPSANALKGISLMLAASGIDSQIPPAR